MIMTGEGGAARRRRALPLCGSLVFAMSGPCGYWSSGLGGGGRAGPNAAGCGALEVEIIWERMQLWRLGGALRAAALHSVSPEAQGRLIFGGTERWSMQDRMPRHRRAMPLTEAANVCERVHLHPTPLTFI